MGKRSGIIGSGALSGFQHMSLDSRVRMSEPALELKRLSSSTGGRSMGKARGPWGWPGKRAERGLEGSQNPTLTCAFKHGRSGGRDARSDRAKRNLPQTEI